MRILWLKSDLLLPLDKGGRLRSWHLLRHLARRHAISYLCFRTPSDTDDAVTGMAEVAQRVETVPTHDAPKGSWRFYADAAASVFDPLPHAVAKYRSREYARHVHARIAVSPFDVIVCDFLCPIVNLPRQLPCPSVLFTHNVESEIWRRHTETHKDPLRRGLYAQQYRRMLRFEARALTRFDGVLAVSTTDRETFGRLYPATKRPIDVIPTGVDTEYFSPAPPRSATPSIVFVGSMDWLPNEDAMQFFCYEVLPAIRVAMPGAHVSIVGRMPTAAVQRLALEPSVTVTGRVDDVRPYLRDASVVVVPLRIGGGTRLKIFEAMAMGKAVVSTTIGAEGLDVTPGEHLMIADDPESFAQRVVELVRDPARREAVGAAARALVVQRDDWSVAATVMDAALADVARSSPAQPAAWSPVPARSLRGIP